MESECANVRGDAITKDQTVVIVITRTRARLGQHVTSQYQIVVEFTSTRLVWSGLVRSGRVGSGLVWSGACSDAIRLAFDTHSKHHYHHSDNTAKQGDTQDTGQPLLLILAMGAASSVVAPELFFFKKKNASPPHRPSHTNTANSGFASHLHLLLHHLRLHVQRLGLCHPGLHASPCCKNGPTLLHHVVRREREAGLTRAPETPIIS